MDSGLTGTGTLYRHGLRLDAAGEILLFALPRAPLHLRLSRTVGETDPPVFSASYQSYQSVFTTFGQETIQEVSTDR